MTSRITGTGSCLPAEIITNDDLAQVVDTSDEWISTRTGIRSRRIVKGESGASMAAEAARRALENAGVSAGEIQLIIVATCTGDLQFPGTACVVQKEIHHHHHREDKTGSSFPRHYPRRTYHLRRTGRRSSEKCKSHSQDCKSNA